MMRRNTTNREKSVIVRVVITMVCIVLIVISAFLPDMGAKALMYKFIHGISMTLLGIVFLLPLLMHFLQEQESSFVNGRYKQESLEEMMENKTGYTSIRSILGLLLGICLLWMGVKSIIACVKDMSSGPVWISLESSRVESSGKGEQQSNNSGNYKLIGLANGEEFLFRLEGAEMYENLAKKINYQVPEIIVVYYPESKAIIQMQIFFDDNDKVVLPEGDRLYDSRSLEKLSQGKGEAIEDSSRYEKVEESDLSKPTAMPGVYAPTTPSYAEVSLEELQLSKIAVGADFKELLQEMDSFPEEERFEIKSVITDDFMDHMKKVVEVKEQYSVSEGQGCDIFYKDDIELIVVYNKESYIIEAIYARRLLTF